MKLLSFAILLILSALTLGHYRLYQVAERPTPAWIEYYNAAYTNLRPVYLILHHVNCERCYEFDVRVFEGKQQVGIFHVHTPSRLCSTHTFELSPILRKLGTARNLRIECSAPYEYFSVECK